jgi:hypothetical protein
MSGIINGFLEGDALQRLLLTLVFPYYDMENRMDIPLAMEKVCQPILTDIEAWCNKSQIEEIEMIIVCFINDEYKFKVKTFMYARMSFETKCILMTAIFRYIKMKTDILDVLSDMYEKRLVAVETSQEAINMANSMKVNGIMIEGIKKGDLIAENYTCFFKKREDRGIIYNDELENPDFALNIGVEKSRIKTLKRQEEMRKQIEEQAKEDAILLKALEEAKPVKISKKQQTKSANKKREQEKKEREDYERRCLEAEAEKVRQQKKKQQQKQAKKKA